MPSIVAILDIIVGLFSKRILTKVSIALRNRKYRRNNTRVNPNSIPIPIMILPDSIHPAIDKTMMHMIEITPHPFPMLIMKSDVFR